VTTNGSAGSTGRIAVELKASVAIDREPDWVFGELNNLEALIECVPGGRMTRLIDPKVCEASLAAGVGPFTVDYAGTGRIVRSNPRSRTASLQLDGEARRGLGDAEARVTLEVKADGPTSTCIVSALLSVTGTATLFGRELVQKVAARMLLSTSRRRKSRVERRKGRAKRRVGLG
jgi:carbon monoxide dehydrogenase subunit G